MSKQLAFDLPGYPALGRGDFFVSAGNAAAVEAIQSWHDWPMGKLLLVGPTGSGKTHLAHVWAAMSEAAIVPAAQVGARVVDLADAAVAVEDAHLIAGDRAAEEALFHLHNLLLAAGHPLLITATAPPARWGLVLPDLQSRMQGSALVSLASPDDALLTAVLVKQFTDRQSPIDADVVQYIATRMDRSFAALARLVVALDTEALAKRQKITKQLVARVLDSFDPGGA